MEAVKCIENHSDMKDTIKTLTQICNTSLQWQAAEETHRSTQYSMMTQLQESQGDLLNAVNDLRVCLHKEFATKKDLADIRDKDLKQLKETELKGVRDELTIVKQNQNKDLKFLITLTLGSGIGGGGVVAILQHLFSLI